MTTRQLLNTLTSRLQRGTEQAAATAACNIGRHHLHLVDAPRRCGLCARSDTLHIHQAVGPSTAMEVAIHAGK